MKTIAVTQRVDNYPEINEIRDCLDQRWVDFIIELIDVNHLEIRQNKNQLGKNLYQKWNEIKLLSKNRESV